MAEQKAAKAPKSTAPKTSPARRSGVETVAGPGPLRSFGGYFKGAWQELRAVRWPNRRNTWGLTLAVLGFTAVFIVLILLVDAGFQFLFQQVILK